MRIEVHLFGKLKELFKEEKSGDSYCIVINAKHQDTIQDIIKKIGISSREISHAFLNHQYSSLDRRVKNGDRLALFGRDMALIYRQYFPKIKK